MSGGLTRRRFLGGGAASLVITTLGFKNEIKADSITASVRIILPDGTDQLLTNVPVETMQITEMVEGSCDFPGVPGQTFTVGPSVLTAFTRAAEMAGYSFEDLVFEFYPEENGFYLHTISGMRDKCNGLDGWWFTINDFELVAPIDTWPVNQDDVIEAGYLPQPTDVEDDLFGSDFLVIASPNPFDRETSIRLSLPKSSLVTVSIYNVNGQRIATLVKDCFLSAGQETFHWNGRDVRGRRIAAGVYFVAVQAGRNVCKKKLVLLR